MKVGEGEVSPGRGLDERLPWGNGAGVTLRGVTTVCESLCVRTSTLLAEEWYSNSSGCTLDPLIGSSREKGEGFLEAPRETAGDFAPGKKGEGPVSLGVPLSRGEDT
jgi:hypothetical protein